MPIGSKRDGISCPYCASKLSNVEKTVPTSIRWRGITTTRIKRTRRCVHCNLTFTTVESYESEDEPGTPTMEPPIPPKETTKPPVVRRNPYT